MNSLSMAIVVLFGGFTGMLTVGGDQGNEFLETLRQGAEELNRDPEDFIESFETWINLITVPVIALCVIVPYAAILRFWGAPTWVRAFRTAFLLGCAISAYGFLTYGILVVPEWIAYGAFLTLGYAVVGAVWFMRVGRGRYAQTTGGLVWRAAVLTMMTLIMLNVAGMIMVLGATLGAVLWNA